MKKASKISCVLLFLLSLSGFSQTLKGTVVDDKNRPVEFMYVINQRTQSHAHTNFKGVFEMDGLKVGDTIVFNKMGFETKQIVFKNNNKLNVIVKANTIDLDQVMLSPEINEDKIITSIDVERNPVKSSQELLTKVPGLIIGQHAGGGKAEQIFYRGFDIDHGTDLQVNVDGMPVNMVSHAHGQGYADLHFVIPETVDKIDFKAGSYHFSQGNFATTGTVNLKSKENLDHNLIKLEGGQFNTKRLLFMNTFLDKTDESAYVAIENLNTDGAFESPQNFKRFNINSKYFKTFNNTKLEFSFSHFVSSWNASGQIPQRAVDNGTITRFGAIDDTEGGETSRTNVSLRMIQKYDDNSQMKHFAYYSKYNFGLYSNFTFFLNEDDGDQIYQKEGRDIFGYNSDYQKEIMWGDTEVVINGGVGLRTDMVGNNQLSETKNKSEILQRLQYGDVNETNYFGYASAAFQYNKWSVNPSLRLDYVSFGYQDFLEDNNTTGFKLKEQSAAIISPRLSVSYTPNNSFQSYFKVGQGFHTNDSRLIITSQANAIPKAYSTDAGFVWKTTPKLLLGLDLWAMLSEQEFVYVGDAGIVEPNGASVRQGVSFNTRYQPIKALFVNFDANYTHARFRDEPSGQDYVPLAPDFTMKGGVSYKKDLGFYAGIDALHIKDRPANEDNSIVAEGYTVANLNMGYIWEKFELGVQIQNLFDVEWNETQFATESRLANEPSQSSVEEIHFTPGTPFFVKGTIAYKF